MNVIMVSVVILMIIVIILCIDHRFYLTWQVVNHLVIFLLYCLTIYKLSNLCRQDAVIYKVLIPKN